MCEAVQENLQKRFVQPHFSIADGSTNENDNNLINGVVNSYSTTNQDESDTKVNNSLDQNGCYGYSVDYDEEESMLSDSFGGLEESEEAWAPVTSLMTNHSSYSLAFRRAIAAIFYGDGPLPFHYRHYLAIMAACRHRCQFLVDLHKGEFLRCGGNETWLNDPNSEKTLKETEKLRDLDLLNKILAHQPWTIQASHLQILLDVSSPNNWSLSELVHGLLVISHVHAFCSFIFGCGVKYSPSPTKNQSEKSPPSVLKSNRSTTNPVVASNGSPQSSTNQKRPTGGATVTAAAAIGSTGRSSDAENGHAGHVTGADYVISSDEGDNNVEQLMQRMRELAQKAIQCSQEDRLQHFLDILDAQNGDANLDDGLNSGGANLNQECSKTVDKTTINIKIGNKTDDQKTSFPFSRFTKDLPFSYIDFVKRADPASCPTFKIHDFSWEDQGYCIINQFCNLFSNVVDYKFRLIQTLTYNFIGHHENVDTSKYRMAVWNYIQSLYGIRHDDYDYSEVNRLLSRQMKLFVKTVGCYPERTAGALRASVMVDFQHSEKVHVNLLIFESRFQAELLYLLRALTRFFNF